MKRRAFLRASMAGCATVAIGPRGRASRSSPAERRFTMDLVPGMIGVSMPFPRLIELAAKHGFESVAPDAGYLAKLSDAGFEELLATMKAQGLRFGAAGLPADFRSDEATFQSGLERLPEFAATLQRAGVARVGTWIRPYDDTLTYITNFRRHARRLRAVAEVLQAHDLRFGLEYVGTKTLWTSSRHPFVHTMAETKELIAAIDRPNVGIVLDSWHWYTAGETADAITSLLKDDIVACDINDAPAGVPVEEQIDNQRELPATTGVIDIQSFLNALVEIGYDGPVRAEPFNAELNRLPDDQAIARTTDAMRRAFALIDE